MTEMFGEAWSPMSVPDLAPDDDDDMVRYFRQGILHVWQTNIEVLKKSKAAMRLYSGLSHWQLFERKYNNDNQVMSVIVHKNWIIMKLNILGLPSEFATHCQLDVH